MKTEQKREIEQRTSGLWRRHGVAVQSSENEGLVRIANSRDEFVAWTEPQNAGFIVRACNAHEDLLAACELCVTILDDYPFEDFTAMTADLIPEALRKLRAVIDKVKGDQP